MLNRMKVFAIVVLAVAGIAAAPSAKADSEESLRMTFQSGATFSGVVTFAPDYSYVEAVSGTLTDYQLGTFGYAGSGSDIIDGVYEEGTNFSSTSDVFSTFLMDGTYLNYVDFTYNYTGAPTLTLDNIPADGVIGYPNNGVDDDSAADAMASGSLSATPEPGTLLLLGSGLAGLVGAVRRKVRSRN